MKKVRETLLSRDEKKPVMDKSGQQPGHFFTYYLCIKFVKIGPVGEARGSV